MTNNGLIHVDKMCSPMYVYIHSHHCDQIMTQLHYLHPAVHTYVRQEVKKSKSVGLSLYFCIISFVTMTTPIFYVPGP